MPERYKEKDYSAAFAAAFFMANLLFVGIFYIALWVLYKQQYSSADTVTQSHLKQSLIAASMSTLIFVLINLIIVLTDGYASLISLIGLEIYYMLIVPIFLLMGIFAFTKAVNHVDFSYPLINRFVRLN